MSREWKPGDVASIEVPAKLAPGDGGDGWVRIVASRSDGLWIDLRDYNYGFLDTPQCNEWRDVRPLVVIDPEDMVAVATLAKTIMAHGCRAEVDLQSALREFANPTLPKPPEPQGLGAVVEDRQGEEWVHFGNGCWIKSVPNANLRQKSWDQIDLARIVGEGVTP